MSSFRDTFTKGERENAVGYDDSAALYFGGCVLFCAASLWTYYFIRDLVCPSDISQLKHRETDCQVRDCTCAICKDIRNEKRRQASRLIPRLFTFRCTAQCVCLVIIWFVFVCIALTLSRTGHIQAFDPFEILQVSSFASTSDIRKAFLKLSKVHHPDRNPSDSSAAARFILITKAYQALTDEVAKANYEKYGNPDGPSALKIGIGLPTFLISKEYQLAILLVCFFVLLIVIPAIFIVYYKNQRRYLPNGLKLETAHFIGYYLKEGTRAKTFPEFLAASAESREHTALRPTDNTEMKPIFDAVSDTGKRQYCTTPLTIRNFHLILAHLQKKNHLLSERLEKDLNVLLKASEAVTQCMAEFAFLRGWLFTLQAVIEFRRRLVQGVEGSSLVAALLQVPHFDETTVKHCLRGRKAVKCFKSFVTQDSVERKGTLLMTPEQIEDVNAFCRHVPLLQISATASVADEETIVEGDVVSLDISLTRNNLKESEVAGFVHAPRFPVLRNEAWWLLVYEKASGKLVSFTRSKDPSRCWVERLQFEAPSKGKWTYQCLGMSDDYVGLDVLADVSITVLGLSDARREVYIHPDDEALDSAPTLLQQMLGQEQDDGQSSDDDEDGDKKKALTSGEKDSSSFSDEDETTSD